MLSFSVIIPLYNRPDEIKSLLNSLCAQTDQQFEVVIVEDGSDIKSEELVRTYQDRLNVRYFLKENSGPGLSRNYGAERSSGNYFIFFDSDCIIPENYIAIVRENLTRSYSDAFGGPDRSHTNFSPIQKAINYSMTSFITTGGIRGKKGGMEKFHPRSFNMGLSKAVYEMTQGFAPLRFGEDIDLSIRIFDAGFSAQLIEEAYVYHQRRTDLKKFFKQVYNSGIARINLFKLHPQSLKLVHFLPSVFSLGIFALMTLSCFYSIFSLPVIIFVCVVFVDSLSKNKNLEVALLSILTSITQLIGYGTGFLSGVWNRIILQKKNHQAFTKNFYK